MPQSNIDVKVTPAQRKAIAGLLPEFTDRLRLDEKIACKVSFTKDELEAIQQKAHEAIPDAENGVLANSLRHIIELSEKAIEESYGIGSIPAAVRIYQFKITLLNFEPTIWRRIQVKDSTLDKLHERIQTAMDWTNSHLHEFEICGTRYGDPMLLDDGFEDFYFVDSTVTKVSEIVPKSGERFSFRYQYDFGDNWQHEVLFEGCLRADKKRYPLCVEGERNCPPEDVGGVWGYAEYLEALANPKHERREAMLLWGGPFDPEEFNAEKVTKRMRRGLPNWREEL